MLIMYDFFVQWSVILECLTRSVILDVVWPGNWETLFSKPDFSQFFVLIMNDRKHVEGKTCFFLRPRCFLFSLVLFPELTNSLVAFLTVSLYKTFSFVIFIMQDLCSFSLVYEQIFVFQFLSTRSNMFYHSFSFVRTRMWSLVSLRYLKLFLFPTYILLLLLIILYSFPSCSVSRICLTTILSSFHISSNSVLLFRSLHSTAYKHPDFITALQ